MHIFKQNYSFRPSVRNPSHGRGLRIGLDMRGSERIMENKIVFIVNVEVGNTDGTDYIIVARNVELREPVWYKESVMKEECLIQHPELKPLVQGKSWVTTIVEWK